MAGIQELADDFHIACMREEAATAGLSADAMLIARIVAASESAGQHLRDAAERELGYKAASALWLATSRRAMDDYFKLSEADRMQLLVDTSPSPSRSQASSAPDVYGNRTTEHTGEESRGSAIALAAAIIRNARPHPVTWGAGHPPYDRFDYLPNGHRDLPEQAPRAFYDSARGGFTERDHLVGLAQAHESGAAYWSAETKRAFALDPDNIYSISPAANMEKSYRDPAEWLPADPSVHVRYASEWVLIKTRWSLTYDEAELAALRRILDDGAAV